MLAYEFYAWNTKAQLVERPKPKLKPGFALIKMAACGACLSDVHIMDTLNPTQVNFKPPFILGHENAGYIEAIEASTELKTGTPVVISPAWGCGQCRRCKQGRDHYCLNANQHFSGGLGYDGGMAQYMLAPIKQLIPLKTLSPNIAAPLTDAGLSAFHAIKRAEPFLPPNSSIVIIGAGGLGHMGIQIAKACTQSQIFVIDKKACALDLALHYGADKTFELDKSTVNAIQEQTSGQGADAIIDFVGSQASHKLANSCCKKDGLIITVGLEDDTRHWNSTTGDIAHIRTIGGSKSELEALIALTEKNAIKPKIHTFTLAQVDQAYDLLRANKIQGRAVIQP